MDGAAVKPKCLVDVGGSTLLHRQIETLRSLNVTKIVVVVGFGQTGIREECDDEIDFVENAKFAETSSLYSLWLAREHLTDGFVVLNSDVLFHPQMLADLLESNHPDALLISDTDTNPLGDEEMKIKVRRPTRRRHLQRDRSTRCGWRKRRHREVRRGGSESFSAIHERVDRQWR